MKKTYFLICVCMVCALVGFLSLRTRQKASDLLLMNIEALASGEGNISYTCAGLGSVDCPGTQVKARLVAYYVY